MSHNADTRSQQSNDQSYGPLHQSKITKEPTENDTETCWICLEPESTTDKLHHLCKCSLVAHEKCIINWALEVESTPSSGYAVQRSLMEPTVFQAVKCPQCGTTIRISTGKNFWVLRLKKKLETFDRSMFIGATLVTLNVSVGWSFYFLFYSFGAAAINAICPPRLAAKALANHPGGFPLTIRQLLGIPLIPVVLVLSTFKSKSVSLFLTTLPMAFFRDVFWRLSGPQFTLSILPFVRELYHVLYQLTAGKLLRRWAALCIKNRRLMFGPASADVQAASGFSLRSLGLLPRNESVIDSVNEARNEGSNEGTNEGTNDMDTTTPPTASPNPNSNEVQGVSLTIGLNELSLQTIGAEEEPNPLVVDGPINPRALDGRWLIGPPSYITRIGHSLLLPVASGFAGAGLSLIPWVRRAVPDRFNRNILGGMAVILARDIANLGIAYMRLSSYNELHIEPYEGQSNSVTSS